MYAFAEVCDYDATRPQTSATGKTDKTLLMVLTMMFQKKQNHWHSILYLLFSHFWFFRRSRCRATKKRCQNDLESKPKTMTTTKDMVSTALSTFIEYINAIYCNFEMMLCIWFAKRALNLLYFAECLVDTSAHCSLFCHFFLYYWH